MAYERFGSRLSEGKLNVPTGFAPLLLFSVCSEMWMPTGHCRPSRFSSTSAQPGWYHSTGTVCSPGASVGVGTSAKGHALPKLEPRMPVARCAAAASLCTVRCSRSHRSASCDRDSLR